MWKNFFQKNLKVNPPKFGLNFLDLKKTIDQQFMLICGFEKFENFFVRIDILERLFIKIIENNKENRIKLNSDMINLLGCNKDNFIKLLELMNYKTEKRKKENEIHFRYMPKKTSKIKSFKKNKKDDNPFGVLTNINYN